MKLYVNLFITLVIGLGSLTAQTFVDQSGRLSSESSFSDTLKILAVMVEFQEDNYDATIGTGKFGSHYTQAYGDTILDPLPHDVSYFSDHLEFAKNYYGKVSGGKLLIDYLVIPQVVTVSKFMREYWPPYDTDDYLPLTDLAKESWEIADQNNPQINFGDFQLFILFHAGVSNSLDDGSLSLDRNLPSLYFSEETLKRIYGESFTGFSVDNGNTKITNTIILPETESREYDLITGGVLLQELTINGVIVTNIASHLGLPDLFDTNTGRSKIGRFGLMDSQASIANWGLFPPMPSAWEKVALGWDDAVLFSGNENQITLTASKIAQPGDTTILRIPINSTEYYLVENRIKDAENNNIILKYKSNGQIFEKTVYPDSDGSYYIENDEIDGVLIDVDDYDASLPGDGIVIWHIDDSVISEKSPLNEINNDDTRRGVTVVEADGIQDIGEIFQTILGDVIVGEGSIEDFWYVSNPAELYENKFANDTKPAAVSNYGSSSNIVMDNFSDISNRMTFRIKFEYSDVSLVTKKRLPEELSPKFLTASVNPVLNNYYVIDSENNLSILNQDGNTIFTVSPFSSSKPAVVLHDGNEYVFGSSGTYLNILAIEDGNYTVSEVDFPKNISTQVVSSGDKIYFGFENGKVLPLDIASVLNSTFTIPDNLNSDGENAVSNLAADGSYYVWTSGDMFYTSLGEQLQLSQDVAGLVLTKDNEGNYLTWLTVTDTENVNPISTTSKTYLIMDGEIKYESSEHIGGNERKFCLADLKNESENSLLFISGNNLVAVNLLGVSEDNYPYSDAYGQSFGAEPLVLKSAEDEPDKLITFTNDGRVNIINSKTLEPIITNEYSSGASLAVHPILFTYDPAPDLSGNEKLFLALINTENDLYVWDLGTNVETKWAGEFADAANSSFVPAAGNSSTSNSTELIVDAYNWPNPVYADITYVRYKVTENSSIAIRVFDLTGGLIKTINTHAVANFDNETTLDVSSYQSGVYFAVLEVVSETGLTASKIIKIAVIK